MILRRLAHSVREQNWFAVLLELLIVVAGVFLGFRVNQWAEERGDRQQEVLLIEQLHADFVASQERMAGMIEDSEEQVEELHFATQRVHAGVLAAEERERFDRAVAMRIRLPSLRLVMGSYRSAVATGEISLLQNRELRSALAALASYVEWEQGQLDYFRRSDWTEWGLLDAASNVVYDPEGDRMVLRVDFEALVADPDLAGVVIRSWRNQSVVLGYRRGIRDRLDELVALLGAELTRRRGG